MNGQILVYPDNVGKKPSVPRILTEMVRTADKNTYFIIFTTLLVVVGSVYDDRIGVPWIFQVKVSHCFQEIDLGFLRVYVTILT
jgi:hypothetical protein